MKSYSKLIGHFHLRNSQDPLISGCIPELQASTWKVEGAIL